MRSALAHSVDRIGRQQLQAKPGNNRVQNRSDRSKVALAIHRQSPSLQLNRAAKVALTATPNIGNAFPPLQDIRDEHRALVARGLALAFSSGQFSKRDLCEKTGVDRKTLDNWMNGHCDALGWKLKAVSLYLGKWFSLYVFGGEIGEEMFSRFMARVEDAKAEHHMDADLAEIVSEDSEI